MKTQAKPITNVVRLEWTKISSTIVVGVSYYATIELAEEDIEDFKDLLQLYIRGWGWFHIPIMSEVEVNPLLAMIIHRSGYVDLTTDQPRFTDYN